MELERIRQIRQDVANGWDIKQAREFRRQKNVYSKIFVGEKKSFLVLNRKLAGTETLNVPYVVISITDCDKQDAKLARSSNCKGVLKLKFSDADEPQSNVRLFTPKDARKILRFVEEHSTDSECIVVHCEAGLSRSPGVASALSVLTNGERQDDFFFKHYRPNSHVRRVILDEAEKLMEPSENSISTSEPLGQTQD